ncbi:MAG: phosphatidate cytidylyltransferase [Pseudomonadota bacterium]|nr:phosphatidate cytidylyltransferase [Pseudomonadota bacterium]
MFPKTKTVNSNTSGLFSRFSKVHDMLEVLPEKQGRVAMGLIMAAVVLFVTLALPAWAFGVAMGVLSVMMVRELGHMFKGKLPPLPILLVVISALCLFFIRKEADVGHLFILYLALVISLNDSGAYLVGKRIGKRKLAPQISPGKTIEGAVGGILVGTLGSVLLFSIAGLPILLGLISGAIIAVSAVAGDLYESKLKRMAGVKDSGTALMHHGGFLDRYDSYLFAAPLLAFPLFILSLL